MQFELTILGCNSALPTAKRFQTAQVLQVLGRFFLIDCGEGTQIQLRRFNFSMQAIDHIFISHLHGDHYLGLPGLLSSLGLLGRTKPLHIYGHQPLKKYLDFHQNMFGGRLGYEIEFHLNNPQEKVLIYEDKVLEVYSFPLSHGKMPTAGFLFKEKDRLPTIDKEKIAEYNIPVRELQFIKQGKDFMLPNEEVIKHEELVIPSPPPRSYAYCSDTKYDEKILSYIKGVDLLYHEATFSEKEKNLAAERSHSTAAQAATIAEKAIVSRLLIGHYSARYPDKMVLEKEAKAIFPNTTGVEDGTKITVPFRRRKS